MTACRRLIAVVATPSERRVADADADPLGGALVIPREHAGRPAPGVARDAITYDPPGSADFVNPNLDVPAVRGRIVSTDDRATVRTRARRDGPSGSGRR